ncbi:MAG: hypothetical protein ACI9EF_002799, partial [Pseudohongiellaceae bacterium]
ANFGYLLTCRGSLDEAEDVLSRAVNLQNRVVGKSNPDSLVMANNLAKTVELQGRLAEARQMLIEVVALAAVSLPEDNWHTGRFRHNLAHCHTALGDLPAAEEQLLAAWDVLHAVLGEAHPICCETGRALVEHYCSTGRPELAKPYEESAAEDEPGGEAPGGEAPGGAAGAGG